MDNLGYAYRLDEAASQYRYELVRDRRPTFAQVRRRTFMTAAIIVMIFMIIRLLTLQIRISTYRDDVMSMRSSLKQMSEDNDFEYRRISDVQNLESIRNIAINELGMVYPKEGQIISFNTEEADYVRQTAPIEDKSNSSLIPQDMTDALKKR